MDSLKQYLLRQSHDMQTGKIESCNKIIQNLTWMSKLNLRKYYNSKIITN